MKQLFRLLGSLLLAVALFIGTASANVTQQGIYRDMLAQQQK